jgi:hypothetical protein
LFVASPNDSFLDRKISRGWCPAGADKIELDPTAAVWPRVGIAFNLYFTAVWNARAGVNATVLGVNVLALGILLILLWCRNTVNDHVHETSLSANAVEPYTTDPDSSPL